MLSNCCPIPSNRCWRSLLSDSLPTFHPFHIVEGLPQNGKNLLPVGFNVLHLFLCGDQVFCPGQEFQRDLSLELKLLFQGLKSLEILFGKIKVNAELNRALSCMVQSD